jgi:polar amino acid transport system permease protein
MSLSSAATPAGSPVPPVAGPPADPTGAASTALLGRRSPRRRARISRAVQYTVLLALVAALALATDWSRVGTSLLNPTVAR